MISIKKFLPAIAKVFTVILVLTLLGLILYKYKSAFIVATINNRPITRFELIKELEKNYAKTTLDDLISKKLIEEEVAKNNIVVSNEEIAAEIKKIEDSLKSQNLTLDAALAMQGMKREELITQITFERKIEKLLAPKVTVTDSEIADYLKNNTGATKEKAIEDLTKQKISMEFSSFLQELRQKANVKILLPQ